MLKTFVRLAPRLRGSGTRGSCAFGLVMMFTLIAGSIFCLLPVSAHAEVGDKPITRKGLEAEIKLGGLKTGELVAILKKRGVDFHVTPDVEIELLRLGAKPDVIDAARANFRGVENAAAPGLSGTWVGSFRTCAQGQSNISMRVAEADPNNITVTVEIAMPGAPPGTFVARGVLNPMNSFLAMMFTGWQHQPPGLSMGNIGGYVTYANQKPSSFSGIIRSPGCGQITLRKQ